LPVSLVPRRFRRKALQFGSGLPTQVICSGMLASGLWQSWLSYQATGCGAHPQWRLSAPWILASFTTGDEWA
jgi:hypothetical protein